MKLNAIYVIQLPQRLAGPAPFPLDRMNAILATLLEEHDLEARAIGPEFTQPGEYTEMELMRVHTSSAVCIRLELFACPTALMR